MNANTHTDQENIWTALAPELVSDLGDLSTVDRELASLRLQVFPFGSRTALATVGAVLETENSWEFTAFGWELLGRCADRPIEDDLAREITKLEALATI